MAKAPARPKAVRTAKAAAPEGPRPCPVCGSAKSALWPAYSKGEWQVHRCDDCGHVYLKNPPSYERLSEEFAYEKTWAAEHERRHSGRPVLRALDRATAWRWKFRRKTDKRFLEVFGAGKVLDIGCGPGTLLPEPLIPFGIEVSKALHAEADANMKRRGGYAVHGPGAEALASFPAGFFEGVLASSILEHEKDPKAMLRGVRRVLAPGGRLYLKVPNFGSSNRRIMGPKWAGMRYPDHVNYFTLPELKRMAEETGYTFHQLDRWMPFSDNVHAVLTAR